MSPIKNVFEKFFGSNYTNLLLMLKNYYDMIQQYNKQYRNMKCQEKIVMPQDPSNSQISCHSQKSNGDSSISNRKILNRQKKMPCRQLKDHSQDKKNHGQWSAEEEIKFLSFMKQQRTILEDKQLRRGYRVFKEMAQFISTRSSEQCRSHYQKYELKLSHFDKIVSYIQRKILELSQPNFRSEEDEQYEFLYEVDEQYFHNPLYGEKPINKCSGIINEFSIGDGQKGTQKTCTKQANLKILQQNKLWKIQKGETNQFKVLIDLQSFL